MSTECLRTAIAVDVLGGDDAPAVVVDGAEKAILSDDAINIILVGPADVVGPVAERNPGRIEAVVATEAIAMDEHPAEAVRSKRDSSIVVGCRLVKEGKAAGFFSAGSTGACMAAATLVMGRVKGVTRPAIATVLPAPAGSVVLLDAGANADVRPDMLLQFAQMGAIYAAGGLGLEQPRIGLLNIGEEDTKGSLLVQEAYGLLKEQVQGFVGNIEGTELLAGKCDVVVTDGFTGNVVLKTVEGAVGALFKQLKAVFGASAKGKLAAALVQGDLRALKDTLSAEKVGGAPLLGVKGVAIIGHGSSSAAAVANGILATAHCARARIPELIAERLST